MDHQIKSQRHLFLDLEDTVIEPVPYGWANTSLMNIAKVRDFITAFKPNRVHLFSFAIYNQPDLKQFDYHIRARLEDALDVKLDMCPTVDDNIIPACARSHGVTQISFSELTRVIGKQNAFKMFVEQHFEGTENITVALLDDSVTDEDFSFANSTSCGIIRNIDQLVTSN